MTKHLFSKIAIAIYLLFFVGLGTLGYITFKQRNSKITTQALKQNTLKENNEMPSFLPDDNSDTENTASEDLSQTKNSNSSNNNPNSNPDQISPSPTEPSEFPVSSTPDVSGSMLANITPEHCDNSCQAFANDLNLFEYCEQSCGISPIKKTSSCDDKGDIQKDYCTKDSAITNSDISICDEIKDANIKQSCRNRVTQDMIEKL